MHPYVNIAVRAARKAGDLITRHLDRLDTLKVFEKGLNDYVTMVDKGAEELIIDTIKKAYPEHGILGEETGEHPGNSYQWIIDPLDGTTNYIHGFPQFCVSIGIMHKEQIEHGVIYDPISQDLYTASRGEGAQLNGKRIRVSNRKVLQGALLGSSFPAHHHGKKELPNHMEIFRSIYNQNADIRRIGSAALTLAYTACGRLDGYWESHLKPWDITAGVILIREAGGFVSDFNGENTYLESGNIVAGNPKVYAELLRVIEEHKI